MRLEFENWFESNNLPDGAQSLFNESCICYKAGAYRSAFLMAYNGLLDILRSKILRATLSQKPPLISSGNWKAILKEVKNEDLYDKKLSDLLLATGDHAVFTISESDRIHFQSFRFMRNACAHGKKDKIDYFNVEDIWSFIQSNFLNLTLVSSVSGAVQAIKDFYDPNCYGEENIENLMDNIRLNVGTDSIQEFLDELFEYISNEENVHVLFTDQSRFKMLTDNLLFHSGEAFHDGLIDYAFENRRDILFQIYASYPQIASEMLSNKKYSNVLAKEIAFNDSDQGNGFWNLIREIINKDIIPDIEMEQFSERLYNKVGFNFAENQDICIILKNETKYFEKIGEDLFNVDTYRTPYTGIDFANNHALAFIRYIRQFGLNQNIVECINSIFSFATYGTFYYSIKGLMWNNPEILDQYISIVQENNMADYSKEFVQ